MTANTTITATLEIADLWSAQQAGMLPARIRNKFDSAAEAEAYARGLFRRASQQRGYDGRCTAVIRDASRAVVATVR